MKAVVFTLGCKVNECESWSLLAGLQERGFEVSDRLEPADLYILNTWYFIIDLKLVCKYTPSE